MSPKGHVPTRFRTPMAMVLGVALLATACSGGAATTSPPAASSAPAATATPAASQAASPTAAALPFKLITPGVLYVSLTDGDMPEIAVGPNNTLLGSDGYWITQFAKKYNLTLKLFPTTLPSEILAVNQGKVDLGTTAFYTQARAQQVYYAYPFYQRTTGVWTLDSFNYTGPDSIKGKRIGEETGYVWVPYEQKTFGASNVHVYTTIAATDQALLNGQVDAIVDGCSLGLPGFGAGSHTVCHPLPLGAFGWPDSLIQTRAYNYVNCGNQGLATALNNELQDLYSSGAWKNFLSTTLKQYQIYDDIYIPELVSPPQLCTP